MTITKAKVKYSAGAPREGQYGPSINILVVFADGKEARIYGKPGDPIQSLKQGEVIDVVDDKGKLKYVESAPLPAPTGVAVIEQEAAEKPDLAAIAFEISSILSTFFIFFSNLFNSANTSFRLERLALSINNFRQS